MRTLPSKTVLRAPKRQPAANVVTPVGSPGPRWLWPQAVDEFGNSGLDETGEYVGSGVSPDNNGDQGWKYDASSGIHYRRTTATERRENRWHDGSLPVVGASFLDDVLIGDSADRCNTIVLAKRSHRRAQVPAEDWAQLTRQRRRCTRPLLVRRY